ncbi:MAG: EpsI family protein [Desulfobacteraceae bacterium]|jgi:EpsI family protein
MVVSSKSYYWTLFLFAVTIILILLINQRGEPKVVVTNLEKIPMVIDGYFGVNDYFPDSVYEELNADQHVYRHYRSMNGKQIDLYIGYYGTAKGGRTGHNPYACLPSAGWGIIEAERVIIPYPKNGKKVSVNSIVAKKNRSYEVVLHWYQSDRNKILSSGIKQNIQRFISRITKNRNDGAFVRVSMLSDSEGLKDARRDVREFTKTILKIIPNYWPKEK